MMMNDAQWYYNTMTPPPPVVMGMDSQDEFDDQAQLQNIQDEEGGLHQQGYNNNHQGREPTSELFTVPHPDNKNLRVVYRYNAPATTSSLQQQQQQRGERRSSSVARARIKAGDDDEQRSKKKLAKQGSPTKKPKTEPVSSVLEIENRVLRDVIAQQQQQQQQPAPSPGAVPATTPQPSVITNNFQSVPSFNVGPKPAMTPTTTTDDFGGMYDISKSAKEPLSVFLYDWFTGTPYDTFDFAAMKRHMARKAAMLADPVIKFVANVAPQCGTTLERLLVSNAVYEGASNMQELVQRSALNQELLSVVLALVLNEMLGGAGRNADATMVVNTTTASTKGKADDDDDDDSGELIPLSPVKKKEQQQQTPSPRVKVEPVVVINACMWDEVSQAKKMLQRHAEGRPLPCQMGHHHHRDQEYDPFDPPSGAAAAAGDSELIGADGFRSLVQGPPLPGHNPVFADVMSILDYSLRAPNIARWNWNNLPENVGMAMIKPEVVAMIESCYEEIRALSPAHAQFTLAHLMTSPRVRHKFALMVGAAINIVPSELQYPGAAPVRGNGSISDRRITMGAMKEFRETLVYQSSKRFFEHVAYAESSAWKDANNTVNEMRVTLDTMRAQMWTLIRELKRVLGVGGGGHAKQNLAQSLGLLDTNSAYYAAVLTAYEVLRVFQWTKDRRDSAVAKLIALNINDAAYASKKAALESEIRSASAEHEQTKLHLGVVREVLRQQSLDGGHINVWKKHFASRLSVVVVPFLTRDEMETTYNQVKVTVPAHVGLLDARQIDMTKVESAIAALVDALKQDMANVNGWEDNRDVAPLLYEAHATASQCLQAVRAYGSASVRYTNALTDVYSMTDEDKRELVYVPPSVAEIPPVRDFLYPQGAEITANIFI